jgi:hypothetical protein
MKLSDALKSIAPARGVTTVIEAVLHGKESLAAGSVWTTESLTEARAMREAATRRQQQCQSDWEYWAHEGDISYWSAVCSLLEAAQIVGENSLPEIPFADRGATVMERCSAQQTWSEQVLTAARATAQTASQEPR